MSEAALRDVADVATILLQVVLALAALWLAWETARVRKSTADLFRATQEAAIAQVRPFLHVSLDERVDDDPSTNRWKYVCVLDNLTQALARRVQVIVFDRDIAKYRRNRTGHSYVAAESRGRRVSIDLTPYSLDEVISDLSLSSRERVMLLSWLAPRARSFMFSTYRDINGRLYCTSREFYYGSAGQVKYDKELQHFGDEVQAVSI